MVEEAEKHGKRPHLMIEDLNYLGRCLGFISAPNELQYVYRPPMSPIPGQASAPLEEEALT